MKIICICGKAGSGKDTVAEMIEKTLTDFKVRVKRIALADSIKKSLSETFKIPISYFYDRDLKEKPIATLNYVTPRKLMQQFGTDFAQPLLGKTVWCQVLHHEITMDGYGGARPPEVYIITDLRFEHELEYFKKNFDDVEFIFIERNIKKFQKETSLLDHIKTILGMKKPVHLSERGLLEFYEPCHSRHTLIKNNRSIERLEEAIRSWSVCYYFNILHGETNAVESE